MIISEYLINLIQRPIHPEIQPTKRGKSNWFTFQYSKLCDALVHCTIAEKWTNEQGE